jgi:glycosyltransferase involved in cell wall biosynthesis
MSSPSVLRLLASMRTGQLERLGQFQPGDVVYRKASYDFDESVTPVGATIKRLGRLALLRYLATVSYDVVELNEPMGVVTWPDLLAQIAVIRLGDLWRRRKTLLVAYCIELVDPATAVSGKFGIPKAVVRPLTRLLLTLLVQSFDRLSFGTSGALVAYQTCVYGSDFKPEAELFEALASPCGCLGNTEQGMSPRSAQAIFVGRFDERKGVRQLMEAWDEAHALQREATLRILGTGPLADEVRHFATTRSEITLDVPALRAVIHEALRHSRVLVLLSQPHRYWREQIGLPILEGLSHGCTVIASSETGLGAWLQDHGHIVLDPACSSGELARALADALEKNRAPANVLDDLPHANQRIVADDWMVLGHTAWPPR